LTLFYPTEIRSRRFQFGVWSFLAIVVWSKSQRGFSSAFAARLLALVVSEPAAKVGAVAVEVVAGV
jgi:hypothetical protein